MEVIDDRGRAPPRRLAHPNVPVIARLAATRSFRICDSLLYPATRERSPAFTHSPGARAVGAPPRQAAASPLVFHALSRQRDANASPPTTTPPTRPSRGRGVDIEARGAVPAPSAGASSSARSAPPRRRGGRRSRSRRHSARGRAPRLRLRLLRLSCMRRRVELVRRLLGARLAFGLEDLR